ncbi:Alpha-galactosidase, glycosyl hydrolase family 4 [Halorhabdus sp. SVX81]|uniref:family 4 glycosyl hydrolase n=1 Tax=Halorhabdus sp. SVX81 TaxID=2978283 RepID=UPI0023DB5DFC|nr:glycoside hydrolase family 4 [Halorhabdus sp. SVX81]WEL16945.1 Alpha-galactosidase, glycosyl hydrolase family 4 [Halorhabdus sp. SVX81]
MTESVHGVQAEGIDTDDVTIAYIGGGSREWAPKFFRDLALSDLSGEVRLHDIDHESAELNAEFGNWVQDRDEVEAEWEYEAVADRDEALDGADVVVLSTQYNPAETFVHDLDIPKDHGIYGAVAATIGPGGIFRAMRTIPVYREFAASIREQCPDAWVFNFTNPVHFVTRALYDEYPDINAVGFCHEVLWTRHHLAKIVEEELDEEAERSDISINVKGINHFTWIDEARYKGRDLWPLLEDLVDTDRANREFTPEDLEDDSPFTDKQQVTWELFRRFGVFPAAGDRHLVEYATSFLVGGKEGLNRWGVKRTTSDYRAKHWNPAESDQTTNVEAWMDGDREFDLYHSNEIFDDMVAALGGEDTMVANVNMPNEGQVTDLEDGAVVETNAVVREGEIKPTTAGGFPRPVRSLIDGHVDTIETIIEASRTGDVDAAFAGFLLDQQVRTLQTEEAREMFAELVAAEEEYLQDWDLDGSDVLAEADAYDA